MPDDQPRRRGRPLGSTRYGPALILRVGSDTMKIVRRVAAGEELTVAEMIRQVIAHAENSAHSPQHPPRSTEAVQVRPRLGEAIDRDVAVERLDGWAARHHGLLRIPADERQAPRTASMTFRLPVELAVRFRQLADGRQAAAAIEAFTAWCDKETKSDDT